ncbi:arylamine N-acetyltransferase family protein [Kitasatospora acidiphila]|uniref:arylamine N-acetyltransferase family protein n=1 Tax=Kitasatospora acidiphila TaxID=2567942 RepID=UPI003C748F75
MRDAQLAAYLQRIDVPRPSSPDLASLRALQRAHLAAVPFENLSVRLGEPITLHQDALVAKVVEQRRGGFCYELNGAFAALLTALGYRVELLGARVFTEGTPGIPMDHLTLRVQLEQAWLVDVGFGRFSFLPLCLAERGEQVDPAGTFRITEQRTGSSDCPPDLDVLADGQPQYRIDQRPYQLADFAPVCWFQATSPASTFTQRTLCSLPTKSGRVSLVRNRLIHTGDDGERTEQELATDQQRLDAYREHFGITLTLDQLQRLG